MINAIAYKGLNNCEAHPLWGVITNHIISDELKWEISDTIRYEGAVIENDVRMNIENPIMSFE